MGINFLKLHPDGRRFLGGSHYDDEDTMGATFIVEHGLAPQ